MGMSDELTVEQRDVLKQVRGSLNDDLLPEHDDEFLLRFIIARKYDAESSIEMLRKHLRCWKKNNFYEILSNYTLEKKNLYFCTTTLGFDKEGSLIRWIKVGQSDVKGMVLSHTPQEAFRLAVYFLTHDIQNQKARRETHGDGKDCKMTYILDLQGLPWSCLVTRQIITHFLYLIRNYESNFPEYLKKAYIVNAPSFIGLILNFVKNVLPSEILGKVIVLTADPNNPVLNDIIDESILPVYLGGKLTCSDDDPECSQLFAIPPGTLVPEEYYLASNAMNLDEDAEAKKTVVLNQSTFSVEIEIKDSDSTILWDFETKHNDIGMGLRFKKDDNEEFETLVPIRRVNSHRFTESGRFDCKTPGIYELFFDNTYSWLARKELTYKVALESNNESHLLS